MANHKDCHYFCFLPLGSRRDKGEENEGHSEIHHQETDLKSLHSELNEGDWMESNAFLHPILVRSSGECFPTVVTFKTKTRTRSYCRARPIDALLGFVWGQTETLLWQLQIIIQWLHARTVKGESLNLR